MKLLNFDQIRYMFTDACLLHDREGEDSLFIQTL